MRNQFQDPPRFCPGCGVRLDPFIGLEDGRLSLGRTLFTQPANGLSTKISATDKWQKWGAR